jgi:CRP-like cAMP-binding protein
LLTLPGLERNLRVLVDWLLDVPFRNDITVLAPQRTAKLARAHYEPGDDVIRQGEHGDCAYVIVDGEAEVLQQVNGVVRRVQRLKSGECFGEIALLANIPRTATVRCVSPVDLIVLPRDQFMALAQGYRDLREALHQRMTARLGENERVAVSTETNDVM